MECGTDVVRMIYHVWHGQNGTVMSYTFNMTSFHELHIINDMPEYRSCGMDQVELLVIIRFIFMCGTCDLHTHDICRQAVCSGCIVERGYNRRPWP